MSDIPDNAPSPRLSIIVKWPDFEGYGFNLHAEKSKPGQYIGKVDAGSPAEVAGLLEGDRIIEVNGVNIANENHKQVVQRIKAVPGETRLLVLDPKADKYYKSKNIVVRGTQENVIVKTSARPEKVVATAAAAPPTPEPEPSPPTAVTNGHHHNHHHHNSHHHHHEDDHDNRSVSSAASSSAASESSSSHLQAGSIPAHADGHHAPDGALEETSAAEPPKERCPTPLPEEGDDSSQDGEDDRPAQEDLPPPVEDEPSLDGEDRPLEEEVKPLDEGVAALHEGEGTPSEGESTPVEGNVASEKLSAAVEGETAASSPEPESDLEAEYDNVELAGGPGGAQVDGAVVPPAPPASTSRRSSSASSSAGSHSSRSSDTAHTDPSTQSVMSTSSTPPSSLEPAPAPAPAPVTAPAPTPAPAPVPAPTAAKPATKPLATNNSYNSSGLNLNMSAAEMRAMLARKKKADPRKDTVDLRKKYEIIQNM